MADDIKYGHSLDGATDYYSVANAWTAATAGTTVVMDYDWHLDECLEVPENTSATIKMNGHKIYRDRVCQNAGRVIKIDEGATLTLDGTGASVEFEYQGLNSQDVWVDLTVTSGGLVTGGFSNDTAGGIDMAGSGATLKLVNVAVAGNKAYCKNGGGVSSYSSNCTIEMKDAQICHNSSKTAYLAFGGYGGGVYMGEANATIKMDNSSISYNWAEGGSGVYCDGKNARIEMKNGSSIDHNTDVGSNYGGAGVYFDNDDFHLIGDKTASISANVSRKEHGGGVATGNDTKGEIEGITFEDNRALEDKAGAIYADSSQVTIKSCSFIDNYAKGNGGAVYSCGQYLTVEGCTFTGNSTDARGGAVYLDSRHATLKDSTFTGNWAFSDDSRGGAIYNAAYYNLIQAAPSRVTGRTARVAASTRATRTTSGWTAWCASTATSAPTSRPTTCSWATAAVRRASTPTWSAPIATSPRRAPGSACARASSMRSARWSPSWGTTSRACTSSMSPTSPISPMTPPTRFSTTRSSA